MTTGTQAPPNVHVPAGAAGSPPVAPPPATPQERALATAGRAVESIVRPGFDSLQGFEALQRMATMFAASSIVPDGFHGKIGDCAIVCELAARTGLSPLFLFQNLYIVRGRPKLSGKACTAIANQSGLFMPLEYRWVGTRGQDDWGCYATTRRIANRGLELKGTTVTWAMVKAEGWNLPKKDQQSKWVTMPEQMFQYRAASMWLDAHYPEGSSGFPVEDGSEVIDVTPGAPAAAPAAENARADAEAADEGPLSPGKDIPAMEKKPDPAPGFKEQETNAGVRPDRAIEHALTAEGAAADAQRAAGTTPFDRPGDPPVEKQPEKKEPRRRGPQSVKEALAKAAPQAVPPAKEPERKGAALKCPSCDFTFVDGAGYTAQQHLDAHVAQKHAPAPAAAPAKGEPREMTHADLVAWFKANPNAKPADGMKEFLIGYARAASAFNEARAK